MNEGKNVAAGQKHLGFGNTTFFPFFIIIFFTHQKTKRYGTGITERKNE